MAIEHINEFDTLNAGREKINKALDDAVTVLKEATDKDVISAPEIILARGGAQTLGERLDEDKAEVSAQLAQKANQEDLEIEKNRIDTIITLPEGSTTNDGRLEDIKIGADGVTYDSPGNAVREQLKNKASIIKLENIALNQNFINGDNLSVTNAKLDSVENNEAYFVTTLPYGHLRQILTPIPNHKYYVGVKLKCTNPNAYLDAYDGGTQLAVKNHSGSGDYELLDFIITPTKTTTIQLRCLEPRSGYGLYVKEMVVIDLTEIYGTGNEPNSVDFKAVLQSLTNSTYFFTNSNVTKFADVVSKKTLQFGSDKTYKNVVTADFTSKTFDIAGKRNDNGDYTFSFKPYGVNAIVSINAIYKSSNDTHNPTINKDTLLFSAGTDWISPYKIKALSNGDTTLVGDEWTGGAHGTTGGSGLPTARTNKVRLFVDGQEKTLNGTYYGDVIELIVINDIEGYNTHTNQRYIVEERIKYKVVDTKIDVHGTIFIKENAELKTYYALQTVGYYNQVKYLDSTNESYVATTDNSDSGAKSLYPISDTRILRKSTTGEELVVWFDNFYGLGVRDYLLDDQSLLATYSYGAEGKTYTHLLVENPINFNSGDILTWRGYYWFK